MAGALLSTQAPKQVKEQASNKQITESAPEQTTTSTTIPTQTKSGLSHYNVVVRCNSGHTFSTIWVPGISFKAARLGSYRLQWCPVGRHVTLVKKAQAEELT
jgi:hypothetical protein